MSMHWSSLCSIHPTRNNFTVSISNRLNRGIEGRRTVRNVTGSHKDCIGNAGRIKRARIGCQSTRHSPKSYDELTGSWNTVLWRVDRSLKCRAGTAVTSWPHVAVGVDSSALFNSPNTYDIPPLSMVLEILCDGDSNSSWRGRPT